MLESCLHREYDAAVGQRNATAETQRLRESAEKIFFKLCETSATLRLCGEELKP